MNRKDTEQALKAELDRHPDIKWHFGRGGRHPVVVLQCNGVERKVVYSSTATERRALLNNVAFLRRVVREMTQ